MGTQKVLIFGSMPCPSWDFLRPYEHWADLVIAADGGVQCAMDAGFTPDIYVGDSDSGGHALIGMECIPLPAEKDLTDLQAAYETALNRGARDIVFTGCTGGRHRSVSIARAVTEYLNKLGYAAYENHRDITRG